MVSIDSDVRDEPYRVIVDGESLTVKPIAKGARKLLVQATATEDDRRHWHVADGVARLVFSCADGSLATLETNGSFIQIAVVRGGQRIGYYHGSLGSTGIIGA